MSETVNHVFCFNADQLGLERDKTYLNFTLSGWRMIASIITGLGSWIAFGGTAYCLSQRNVTFQTGAKILLLTSFVGYFSISYAKRVRHYDQRSSILSYKKEIADRLTSDPKTVLQFIKEEHGWGNIDKILRPVEKNEVLRRALCFVDFFSAVQEYPKLDEEIVLELWNSWSSNKTILELIEECDFQKLEKVLPDVYKILKQKKAQWNKEIQPVKIPYSAYRNQTRKERSEECSKKERKLITNFDYEALLNFLKNLQEEVSCRPIEFF